MADLTKARRGLDLLLNSYPNEMIAKYDAQVYDKQEHVFAVDGPWVCVDLSNGLRFAIWKETGSVYAVGEYGAVEDDPLYEIAKEMYQSCLDGHGCSTPAKCQSENRCNLLLEESGAEHPPPPVREVQENDPPLGRFMKEQNG